MTMLPLFLRTKEEVEAAEAQIAEKTKRIDYFITEYTIEHLAQKVHENEYTIPGYQREYTWDSERKWRFIESLLINLPVPFIFFFENPVDGKLEIVDGSQRLRTLAEFVYGDLALGELDKLSASSGFMFRDFSEARRRKFLNRSIRGIVLNEHADDEARFDLFDRINTGSLTANPAEVRRGALPGLFTDLVIELAKDPLFVNLTPVPEKQVKTREREELVTRFFAYGDGLEDYADEVTPFLFLYTKQMNDMFSSNEDLIIQYEHRFHEMTGFVRDYFPYGFRKSPNGRASPRARFESIAIGTSLALRERPGLTPNRQQIAAWIASEEFAGVTGSDGANGINRLKARLSFVRDRLLENSR
ncbi:hypothetical protein Dcar01_03673 [Deinococcus carri]|uniref:GmrSD restriction endonucleases N-terminal domain-containing protein n=1 Tax=Deinococcus carri TaxID=1211323 RepID=A0ABP9WC48_9DEIO